MLPQLIPTTASFDVFFASHRPVEPCLLVIAPSRAPKVTWLSYAKALSVGYLLCFFEEIPLVP